MIFGDHVGLKLPDICPTSEENPEKPHPGDCSRQGIELGPAAWQACMLPPSSQRWTNRKVTHSIFFFCFDIKAGMLKFHQFDWSFHYRHFFFWCAALAREPWTTQHRWRANVSTAKRSLSPKSIKRSRSNSIFWVFIYKYLEPFFSFPLPLK